MIALIPSLLWQQGMGRVLHYMIQRKFQLGMLVIVIVVTLLNLYHTGPGATFVWISMQIFRNIHLSHSFTSSTPFWTNLGSAPAAFVDHATLNVVPIWLVLTCTSESSVRRKEAKWSEWSNGKNHEPNRTRYMYAER